MSRDTPPLSPEFDPLVLGFDQLILGIDRTVPGFTDPASRLYEPYWPFRANFSVLFFHGRSSATACTLFKSESRGITA